MTDKVQLELTPLEALALSYTIRMMLKLTDARSDPSLVNTVRGVHARLKAAITRPELEEAVRRVEDMLELEQRRRQASEN